MDSIFAIGAVVVLVLRFLPFLLGLLHPNVRQFVQRRMVRFRALVDVGGGTLMVILVALLLFQQRWILAALLAAISLPSWYGMMQGLRILARTPR
jgi:hypothetical protein